MVLNRLLQLIMLLSIAGCSAIGYVKYEEKVNVPVGEEVSKEEEGKKYIVKEYYLIPEEWWFEYPRWRWSIGFYLWEPYWWYPYYYTRCPGCYLYDPSVFKGYRKFEKKSSEGGDYSEPESGGPGKEIIREAPERKGGGHRRFER